MQFIECMFSCKECGQHKVKFKAPARQENQDVVDYVKSLATHAGIVHTRGNLLCAAKDVDLWIPVDEQKGCGYAK